MPSTLFTDAVEKYITTPPEERKKRYDSNARRQYDYKIRKYGKDAVRNLALIAAGYELKQNREIFGVEEMWVLLNAVVTKRAGEVTHRGEFFLALIDAIISAAAASAIRDKKEILTVKVERAPIGSPPFEQITYKNVEKRLKGIL